MNSWRGDDRGRTPTERDGPDGRTRPAPAHRPRPRLALRLPRRRGGPGATGTADREDRRPRGALRHVRRRAAPLPDDRSLARARPRPAVLARSRAPRLRLAPPLAA